MSNGRTPPAAVVFDADDTLVDIRPAVRSALQRVLDELRQLTPAAAELSLDDLLADEAAAFAELKAEPVVQIRRAALGRSLARVGLASELDRIADMFFAHRFAVTQLYDAVPELLAGLRRDYWLGFATNGNSHAHRLGLADAFTFTVYAHVDGVPKKPAPGFFEAVVAGAGLPPGAIVHVGDSWEHDVAGAAAAGLRTVWLNRAGAPRPDTPYPGGGPAPNAEIRSLAELPAALTRLAFTRL